MTARRAQLAAIVALFTISLVVPYAGLNPYFLNVLVLMWIYLIVAMSLNLCVGYLGLFSFAFTGFMGLGGYATGLVTTRLGWPAELGLLVAIGMTAGVALLAGFAALRLTGVYFVMLTIALHGILVGIANSFYQLTGGTGGLAGIPPLVIAGLRFDSSLSFYYVAFGTFVILFVAMHLVVHSRVGRAFVAIRDNQDLADSLGISPFRYKLIGFVGSAVLGGIAGWLYAHYVTVLDPQVFGFELIFDVLFMVMLGGQGTMFGPVTGALVVTFVPEALRFAETARQAVFSIFLLIVVVFVPEGIWGTVQRHILGSDRKGEGVRG